jgi:hypothetical protein
VKQSEEESSRLRFLLSCFLLGAVILFEYGESFTFYFVGDDFAFIEFVLVEKTGLLWKSPSFFHYYPLGVLFNALPAYFGVLSPHWYVLIGFLSYWGCSILVMAIFRSVTGSRLGSILAALMFATALPNSEVIFWKTGNQTIAMTMFSLLALFLFIRYLNEGAKWDYAGCAMSFVASMLCIEQGSVTFGILLLYDLFLFSLPQLMQPETKKREVAVGILRRHSILLCIPVLLSWLKYSLGYRLLPIPPSAVSFSAGSTLIIDTLIRLLDFNQIFFSADTSLLALSSITLLLLTIFLGYIAIRRNMAALFFLLASTGSILVVSLSAGGPSPRYFCLPLALYACFLSAIFKDIAALFVWALVKLRVLIAHNSGSQKEGSEPLNAGFHIAICLLIILTGLRGNVARRAYWQAASQIEKNMVDTVVGLFSSGTIRGEKGQQLFLLNIPAAIRLEKYSHIYIAQNSLIPDLKYRLGTSAEEIVVISGGTQLRMPFGDDLVAYRPLRPKNRVSQYDIRRILEEGHVVLQFSPPTRMLVPVGSKN